MQLQKKTEQASVAPSSDIDETLLPLPEGAIARFGRGMVEDLEFSPDGHQLVVGAHTGVWWYELASMVPQTVWETEKGVVGTISFSPDGRWFTAGNWDGTLKIWDIQRGVCIARLEDKFTTSIRHTFSPDGKYLAVFARGRDVTYIVDPELGEPCAALGDGGAIRFRHPAGKPLAFSPDSQLLANASPDNDFNAGNFVSIWDMETRERIAHLTEYPDRVYGLSFSQCGRFLAVGCWGGTLRVWDLVTGKLEIARTDYGKYRMCPKYLQDGRLIVAGLYHYDKQEPVEIWDIEPNEKLETIELRTNVNCARFSDCGTQLAIASHGEIKVWTYGQLTTNTLLTLQGHRSVVQSVVFSQDGRTLAAGIQRDNLLLWDIEKGHSQRTLDLPLLKDSTDYVQAYIVHKTPAGKIFTMGINRQEITKIRVWDVGNSRFPISEFRIPPKKIGLRVEFSPEADQLVKGDRNGILSVWDVRSGHERYAFTAHTKGILALAFSTDGKRLVSTSRDGTARLWDVESGESIGELPVPALLDATQYKGDVEEIQRIQESLSKGDTRQRPPEIMTLIFSPRGNVIAGGMHKEIRLWDGESYETRLAILLPHGCQRPFALAFSPCERYLASGAWWQGTDKVSIRLWEVASGENIATFWGHPTDVQSLAFSPDGTLLASGSYDGTILLWDMKPYLSNETA